MQTPIHSLFTFLLCFLSSAALTQTITIKGMVTGADNGEPLIGATLLVTGTDIGTITDIDGTYELEAPADAVLQVSYVGYQPKEVRVAGRAIIDISLDAAATSLDEVVVIGYGTSKKRDLTGSVASIKAEDIQAVPIVSADQALQGRAAGVFVQQNSGEPGAGTTIRIRGTSSISAGNEPLFVIDGVPILTQAGDISTEGAKGPQINPLSTINPNDIASIEILKDASAAAIYGARAANGVVLITTKRGTAGQSNVDFSWYQGWQEVRNPYELLNASQFAHFTNEANFYAGNGRVYTNPEQFGEGTDWQDEIFRTAPMSNYELSFTGGSKALQYAISGGFYKQDGAIIGSDFKRYNFRANLDGQVSPRFKLSNSLMVSHTRSNKVTTDDNAAFDGGIITAALSYNPMVPVRDEDGNFINRNYEVDDNGELIDGSQLDENGQLITEQTLSTLANPILKVDGSPSEAKITRIIENLSGTLNLARGLDLKITLGGDFAITRSDQFTPRNTRSSGDSFSSSSGSSTLSLLNENTLSYKRDFGGKHSFNTVAGFSMQKTKISSVFVNAIDFSNDQFGFNNYEIARGADINTNFPDFNFLSGLARFNYSYDNKYLVTLTGRYDGSSKFGENNKWGFFPSASVAWVLSEEDFVKDLGLFDFFKIRMGYGIIGNESIGPFLSQALLVPVDLAFNDQLTIGFEPFLFPNSDLRWESTEQFNAGVDVSFAEGRLSLTADYYIKNTFDLLLTTDVPLYTGFSNVFSNVGDLENKGFEFSFTSYNLVAPVSWQSSFNISFNKNTITNLAGRDEIPNSGANLFGIQSWALLKEGEEVGKFYGLETDGIFQIGEDPETTPKAPGQPTLTPGDRKFVDQNGDGLINDGDRVFIGNAQPDFTFGFNNSFSYKNFDLNVFIQGVYGNEIVNFNKFLVELPTALSNVTLDYFANRWTPQNPSDIYPKVNADPGFTRNFISDAEVEDGSYVRLKTITLGYRLSEAALQRLKLSNVRIYLTAKNLLTWTDYSGFDPEVSHFGTSATSLGADLGGYPNVRSFLFGVNIGF